MHMRNVFTLFSGAPFVFLCLQTAGQAETLYGKVTQINAQKGEIKINTPGKYRNLPKHVDLICNPSTELKGIDALSDIDEGESILVDAQRQDSKTWVVEVLAPAELEQKKKAPSDKMKSRDEARSPAGLESEPFLKPPVTTESGEAV
jgi:hypothetical protein